MLGMKDSLIIGTPNGTVTTTVIGSTTITPLNLEEEGAQEALC